MSLDHLIFKKDFNWLRMPMEIQPEETSTTWYTTVNQFEVLLKAIDTKKYERELMEAIENIRDEITENMKLTEALTAEKKPTNRMYLGSIYIKIHKILNDIYI